MTNRSAAVVLLPSERCRNDSKHANEAAAALSQGLADLRLAEMVEQALRVTGYRPLRAIEVTVRDQLVILTGHVQSYYQKQFAQAVAMDVAGVRELRNDLQVARPHDGHCPDHPDGRL